MCCDMAETDSFALVSVYSLSLNSQNGGSKHCVYDYEKPS